VRVKDRANNSWKLHQVTGNKYQPRENTFWHFFAMELMVLAGYLRGNPKAALSAVLTSVGAATNDRNEPLTQTPMSFATAICDILVVEVPDSQMTLQKDGFCNRQR